MSCKIKALVVFEESQAVTIELRKLGCEAYSCDLLPCSGGFPQWHMQMDARQAINMKKWDLIIMHPPCTYTAICGNRWYYKSPLRDEAAMFTKQVFDLAKSVCCSVVLEQPKTIMQRYIGRKSQVIHPYQFGHGETKETWLWVVGLPLLQSTKEVSGREPKIWKMPPSEDRAMLRSKTYKGIAQAMAVQWFNYLQKQQL